MTELYRALLVSFGLERGRVGWARLAMVFVLSAAGLFYLSQINRHGFWWDEWMTLQVMHMGVVEIIRERLAHGHGPVYFYFLKAWSLAAGMGEVALRLPSVAFALCAGWLTYLIGRALSGRWVGVIGAALLLGSPTTFWLAIQARPYTLAMALVLASMWWILRCEIKGRERGQAWVLAGLNLLALATHYSTGLFLAGELAYLLWRVKRRPDLAVGAGAGGALGAVFPLASAAMAGASGPVAWIPVWRWESVPGLMAQGMSSESLVRDWPWGMLLMACGVMVLGALGVRRMRGDKGGLVVLVWWMPMLLAFVMAMMRYPDIARVARYFAGPLAAQMVAVGAGVQSVWRKSKVTGQVVAALICVVCGWSLTDVAWNGPEYPYRDVARLIEKMGERGDMVVVAGPHFELAPWFYYAKRPTMNLLEPAGGLSEQFEWGLKAGDFEAGEGPVERLKQKTTRVWLVPFENVKINEDARRQIMALTHEFSVIHEHVVKGRTVFELEMPSLVAGTGMDPSDGVVEEEQMTPTVVEPEDMDDSMAGT